MNANTNRQGRLLGCLTMLAMLLVAGQSAEAIQMLGYDYRVDQSASFVSGGLPTGATLLGDATVSTATAVGIGTSHLIVSPKIETGYLNIADRTGDGVTTSATYAQAFGSTNNFANGTVITVFKPSFSSPTALRHYFWGVNANGNPNHMAFLADGNTARLGGGRGTENAFDLLSGSLTWNPNSWYLLGASWQQSSGPSTTPGPVSGFLGLADGKLRLYARELKVGSTLTPNSTVTYASNEATAVWDPRLLGVSSSMRLGNRANFTEVAAGSYALFEFYNTTFSQADFTQVFDNLLYVVPVPEPTTFSLVSLGVIGVVAARRRKRA